MRHSEGLLKASHASRPNPVLTVNPQPRKHPARSSSHPHARRLIPVGRNGPEVARASPTRRLSSPQKECTKRESRCCGHRASTSWEPATRWRHSLTLLCPLRPSAPTSLTSAAFAPRASPSANLTTASAASAHRHCMGLVAPSGTQLRRQADGHPC